MNAFTYWLRRTLGLTTIWYCQCEEHCVHYFVGDREFSWFIAAALFAGGSDHIYRVPINHSEVHAACTHCTNPLIYCRRCGAHYLDRVEPSPLQWRYLGLWRGWEHVRSCRVGGGD